MQADLDIWRSGQQLVEQFGDYVLIDCAITANSIGAIGISATPRIAMSGTMGTEWLNSLPRRGINACASVIGFDVLQFVHVFRARRPP